jgi:hypothetical protein
MPDFFLAFDRNTIEAVLAGTIPSDLEADLSELITRPLIIRTDGGDIPIEKREMLPRSDPLRAYSGPCRSTFRGDGDHDSGGMTIRIPG